MGNDLVSYGVVKFMKEQKDKYEIFSESVRDRQLFWGGRGIKLHTVRHQSDDGWIGGRTGSPAVCQSKKKESYLQTTEPD
mgnify:CR=1 FL=1